MGRCVGCAHPRNFPRGQLPGRHGVINFLAFAAVDRFLLHREKRHLRPDFDKRPGHPSGVGHDPAHIELSEDDEDQKVEDERGPGQAP